MKLGILTSGDIGKDTLRRLFQDYEIYFVLTDSNSLLALLNYVKTIKFLFLKGNPRDGNAYEFVKNYNIDVNNFNKLFIFN